LRKLLTGNEAVAQGVIDSGVEVVCGYPGTPSTEVILTLLPQEKDLGIHNSKNPLVNFSFYYLLCASIYKYFFSFCASSNRFYSLKWNLSFQIYRGIYSIDKDETDDNC